MYELVKSNSESLINIFELILLHKNNTEINLKPVLIFIYNILICDESTVDKIIELGLL